MTKQSSKRARIQLAMIALLFFGPLVVAAFLYYGGYFTSMQARSNHGTLLRPTVALAAELPNNDTLGGAEGKWLLVAMIDGPCGEACESELYTSRQSREMLGRERDRVTRVLLHGADAPDTVFLDQEHSDLITTVDGGLGDALKNNSPTTPAGHGYFLIDPLGNLVMHFESDLEPSKMVEDIEHLLRLSRIG
ncbi:MAG: hypothetical protein AAF351_00555 [Pseudomonadota bacterium]